MLLPMNALAEDGARMAACGRHCVAFIVKVAMAAKLVDFRDP